MKEAKAAAIEMRNAEKLRQLISLGESLSAVDAFCGVVLVELNALPAPIGRRDLEARRAVDAQVRATQQRIADRIGALSDAHRSGASLDDAVRRTAGNGAAA